MANSLSQKWYSVHFGILAFSLKRAPPPSYSTQRDKPCGGFFYVLVSFNYQLVQIFVTDKQLFDQNGKWGCAIQSLIL